jgi:diguanylate cyclase (GGDEF)-like protein
MVAGLSAWALGALIRCDYETWPARAPTWATVIASAAFLLFPVGASVALLQLSPASGSTSRTRLILDAAIVAISLFVVSWVGFLHRVFGGSDLRLAPSLTLAQLVADVVVVAVAGLVWAAARPAHRTGLCLLAGGVILTAMADIGVAYRTGVAGNHTHSLLDLGWFAGFGAVGLAALWGIRGPSVDPSLVRIPSRARLWLPYVPLPLVVALWLGQVVADAGLALLVMTVLLVIAVLARQFVVLVENQRLLADVTRLAFRDELTGLGNRVLFLDRLEQAVARQRREQFPLAVLCLDLDKFKSVNDDLGHPAGDELLVRVAERISACLRSTDTVARVGGDEFAVVIEGNMADSLRVADRILDAFSSPIVIEGAALTVRPSIGWTLATANMPQTAVDNLIRQADLAMYAAKRDGGGCVRRFVPDLTSPYDRPELSAKATTRPHIATTENDRTRAIKADAQRHHHTVPQHAQWPPLSVRIALGAVLIGVVVFAMSTVVRAQPGRIAILDGWLEVGLELSAAGLVAIRAWRVIEERWAWLFIAAGMTATALGTVVYSAWVPEGQLPSIADPLYLAFYPLVYTGLLLLMRTRLQTVPAAIRLDALVVGLTAAAVAAALASGPIAATMSGSPVTVLVGMAYPAAGMLLLALATATLAIVGWRTDRRWGLIVAGFVLWVVANMIYLFETAHGSYLEGTWIDACWPTAFLLVAIASWLPQTVVVRRPKPGLESLIPPMVCAIIALAVPVVAHEHRLPAALAASSLIAVAARIALTMRDGSTQAKTHQPAVPNASTRLANLPT